MRTIIRLLTVLTLLTAPGVAQTYFHFQGLCREGGNRVVTQGLNSTNYAVIVHPGCTVNVYTTGTINPVTLFADNLGNSLSNPFTASTTDGTVSFWVNTAVTVDVVMSGGNPTFPNPYTLTAVALGAPGGGGGGGGSPGGSVNDVQTNLGGGTFGGTAGNFTYDPTTKTVTVSSAGTLSVLGTVDFSAALITRPNKTGISAALLTTSCTVGETAFATDITSGANVYPCVGGFFIPPASTLPSPPGVNGSFIMNNGGTFGFYAGLYWDPVGLLAHVPGGLSLDGTKPFSLQGLCPVSTPLGSSAVGTTLIGWDVGCTPKISVNGATPATIGLLGFIDYTYQKDDANSCWALTNATGDVGICRIGAGVLGIMNPAATTTPSKVNVYSTFTSNTNSEYVSVGWSPPLSAYFVGADHGSLGGSYHPLYLGAAGIANPFWAIQTVGPLTCLAQNPSCDFGSLNTAQMIRNGWFAGFIANNVIGSMVPVNSGGVKVGLVAAPIVVSGSVQALTATVAQVTGNLGIVGAVTNGTIPSLTIVSGGSGYTGPTCQVSAPPINSGVTATCTATQLAGVINSVTVTNIGSNSGYESIQSTTVTINDANGTGAVVIPVITATNGFALIASDGSQFSPIFDGNVSAKDRITVSTTVAGELHDTGITCTSDIPLTVQTYGCGLQNVTGAAGISAPLIVKNRDASSTMLLAVTPSGTSCPTAASVGATCKDTVTITPAMPDTNYIATCNITAVTSGVPTQTGILTADKLAGSFKVSVAALTAVAAQVTNYDCDVRHQ